MTTDKIAAREIIESLRKGQVPIIGVDEFLVDRTGEINSLGEDLEYVKSGSIGYKSRYLRGHYGSGKTFLLHYLLGKALQSNFVTSLVVLDNRENRLDRLENVYRNIMENLESPRLNKGANALAEILGNWNKVHLKDGARWLTMHDQRFAFAPSAPYFGTVLFQYFSNPAFQSDIISWLMGGQNISFAVKRLFGVRGEIDQDTCMNYLAALTSMITESGYAGLVILIDEAESILKLPRHVGTLNALENIRMLDDNTKYRLKHAYVVFAGTYDFFDTAIPLYPALNERLKSVVDSKSYRQPIIDLDTMPSEERVELLRKIESIYLSAYDSFTGSASPQLQAEPYASQHDGQSQDARETIRKFIAHLDGVYGSISL